MGMPCLRAEVYPRPRGGTAGRGAGRPAGGGLSPPTRGNPRHLAGDSRRLRSIPAHAGEPRAWRPRASTSSVYPRPRGGTWAWTGRPACRPGLSPPTRGNPPKSPPSSRPSGVYPRPRGGTGEGVAWNFRVEGLSPPTRGNRREASSRSPAERSIPAHAGEPASRALRGCRPRVYPRPRGGTSWRVRIRSRKMGLSPPTRGNLLLPLDDFPARRSIPAHAGEPAGDV